MASTGTVRKWGGRVAAVLALALLTVARLWTKDAYPGWWEWLFVLPGAVATYFVMITWVPTRWKIHPLEGKSK